MEQFGKQQKESDIVFRINFWNEFDKNYGGDPRNKIKELLTIFDAPKYFFEGDHRFVSIISLVHGKVLAMDNYSAHCAFLDRAGNVTENLFKAKLLRKNEIYVNDEFLSVVLRKSIELKQLIIKI
jgi:hypothetical protein